MNYYYYLYLIQFEDGRYYIGSRKSKIPASEDVNYWGSPGKINESLWKMKKKKYILFESTSISYEDLIDKEKYFIRKGWEEHGKDRCVNKNIGGNIDPQLISKFAKENYAKKKNPLANLTPEQRTANALKANQGKKMIEFKVRDPNGKIHTAKGIYPFAKKHGLNGANLWEVVRGRCDSYKGWTNIDVDPSTILTPLEKFHKLRDEGKGMWSKESKEKSRRALFEKNAKEFYVRSPEGKTYEGKGRNRFAREHGLPLGNFGALLRGERGNCRGWTRVEETE